MFLFLRLGLFHFYYDFHFLPIWTDDGVVLDKRFRPVERNLQREQMAALVKTNGNNKRVNGTRIFQAPGDVADGK